MFFGMSECFSEHIFFDIPRNLNNQAISLQEFDAFYGHRCLSNSEEDQLVFQFVRAC